MRLKYYICLMLISTSLFGNLKSQQVCFECDPFVVANFGYDTVYFGGFDYQFTVGEVATQTLFGDDDFRVTEGYNQPTGPFLTPVEFTVEASSAQCPDLLNGTIFVTPGGCEGPYEIEIISNSGYEEIAEDVEGPYTFRDLDSGTYRVTVRGFSFCSDRDTVVVDMKNTTCDIVYYNGITPNGDGKNDYWEIDNVEINLPNEVSIFNRWGTQVWQGENYDNVNVKFEGRNAQGQDLPSGTYFYTISVTSDSEASSSGWIQITR